MKKTKLVFAIALLTGAVGSGAVKAQTNDLALLTDERDFRVGAGITIPFGGNTQSSKPRVEFAIQQLGRDNEIVPSSYRFLDQRVARETRIGIPLFSSPKLMLNGQELRFKKVTANLDTGEAILIGAGFFAVAGVVAVLTVTDDIRDSIED